MPKFTFIGEHTDLYGNSDGTKVTYEFHVDSLEDVLQHTDLFIRGCGYNPTGTLDYVPDEEYYGEPEWTTEEFVTPQEDLTEWNKVYSKHYFDSERNK